MDYEQKYKEALERAKDILSYKEVRQEDMEYLFPELAESEDERIRKELIKFHKSTIDIGGIKGEQIIALLEKQGEQKLANSAKTCKKSQRMISAEAKEVLYDKPAWSDEDDVRLQACLDTLQAKSLMGVVDTNMTKWLKSLKQRIGG